MSTSQKIGLASVALICLILIGFYLGQDDPRARRDLPAAAAIEAPSPDPAESPAKSNTSHPALVLPSASNDLPPTGLDAIVSRIKSETDSAANPGAGQASTLASNTPASIADRASSPTERIVPLAEASAPPTTDTGKPVPPADDKPANPLIASDAGNSAAIASDTGKVAAEPAITPAPSIATEKGAIEKITEVPSLTLGASTDKAEATPYKPVPPFDTNPAVVPAKDDPKQFADLAIIDDADPALARAEKPASDAKVDAATPGAAAPVPADAPAVASTETKVASTEDRAAASTDAAVKTDPHAALPVSSQIPFVVPRPDANKPAVKPDIPAAEKALPVETPPAVAGKPYTIKAGDTFSSIAAAVYGAEKHWIEIAEANPKVNPSKLKLGQVITLPELPTDLPKTDATVSDAAAREPARPADTKPADATKLPPPKPADAAKPADPRPLPVKVSEVKFHEVKAGENLATISRKHFNTGEHWRHIYVTNREIIGSDPGRLHVGMKLKITAPVKTAN